MVLVFFTGQPVAFKVFDGLHILCLSGCRFVHNITRDKKNLDHSYVFIIICLDVLLKIRFSLANVYPIYPI